MASENGGGGGGNDKKDEEHKDVGSISVQARVPEFWTDLPKHWFFQAEAILAPQKWSDEQRYQFIIGKLGKDVIQQVTDILISPPAAGKFDALKTRLLEVYEESESRKIQKLIGEMDLGDQRPSQLLRRMKDLARGRIEDETLMILWKNHLPVWVRGVLAVSDIKDLTKLALMADKVMENARPAQVASVDAAQASCDESAERSLIIVTAPVVGVVGEKKAIYCKGNNVNSTDMEWLDPRGKVIPLRSNRNNRVYVENYKTKDLVVLIIFSLQLEDSGNWTCRTKDEELNQMISIFAGIRADFSGDDEKKVEEGNAIKLTCKAKGFPTPQVYWTSENYPKTIESDNRIEIRKDDSKGIYTLLIKHASYQDAGVYYCKLYQDILKHHAIKKITVEVIHKPIMFDAETNLTIEEPPKGSPTTASIKEVFVVLNEPKTLRCAAVGNPKPQFIWSYKDENGFFREIRDEYMMTHDDYSSNLTFTLMEDDPLTMFRCLAKNDKGRTMLLYDIHIGNRPVPPDDIKFISANTSFINFEVTCTNCTFETTDPEHLAVIGYGFQLVPYEEGYPPNWPNSTYIRVPIEIVNVTTFSVGPLEKGTTYHVRVSSYNQASDSDWLEMGSSWLELTKTDNAPRLASTLLLLVTTLFVTMCF